MKFLVKSYVSFYLKIIVSQWERMMFVDYDAANRSVSCRVSLLLGYI